MGAMQNTIKLSQVKHLRHLGILLHHALFPPGEGRAESGTCCTTSWPPSWRVRGTHLFIGPRYLCNRSAPWASLCSAQPRGCCWVWMSASASLGYFGNGNSLMWTNTDTSPVALTLVSPSSLPSASSPDHACFPH